MSMMIYHYSVIRLTPTLMVGITFAITNMCSSTFAILVPYVVETIEEPIITITYASLVALFATWFLCEDTQDD